MSEKDHIKVVVNVVSPKATLDKIMNLIVPYCELCASDFFLSTLTFVVHIASFY